MMIMSTSSSSSSSNDATATGTEQHRSSSSSSSLPQTTPSPPSKMNVVHHDNDESMSSTTAVLFAIISLALYWLFLRPTTNAPRQRQGQTVPAQGREQQQQQQRPANTNGNGNHRTRRMVANNINNNNNPFLVEQQQQRMMMGAARPTQQQQQQIQTTSTTSTTTLLSESARDILEICKTKPPHFKSTIALSQIKIGGTNVLIDGLVAFSNTEASSSSSSSSSSIAAATTTKASAFVNTSPRVTTTTGGVISSNNNNNYANVVLNEDVHELMVRKLRQERAKILSRLFENVSRSAVISGSNSSTSHTSNNGMMVRPPPRGGTLVVGLPYDPIFIDPKKKKKDDDGLDVDGTTVSSLDTIVRVLYCLATYYTVMVMVHIPPSQYVNNNNNSNDYETTQRVHQEIVTKLRTTNVNHEGDDTDSDNNGPQCYYYHLSESVLPSHRIMVSSSSITGRVALVRQLSTVELVVDYDPEIKTQLERFGYKVAIFDDETEWNTTFPFLRRIQKRNQ